MAANSKTISTEMSNQPVENWVMVVRRRGKQRRHIPKLADIEIQEDGKPWVPTNLETNPEKELGLMNKVLYAIDKLEKSDFFQVLIEQIHANENLERFRKVLGSEENMQIVLYGVGSLEFHEIPRLQLSLALLIQRNISWIGDVEVFDPVMTLTEVKVMEALGCSVLSVNEQGKKEVLKPILFIMPHCEATLYENLLKTNWSVDKLSRIIVLGNSFDFYRESFLLVGNPKVLEARKHVLATSRFTKELEIMTVSDDYYRAFQGLSWHFFNVDANENLKLGETDS